VLKAALGGAAAVGAVGVAARVFTAPPTPGRSGWSGEGGLALAGEQADGIGELEVPLTTLARSTGDGSFETVGMTSTPYSMLALTWDRGAAAPPLEVRTRTDGAWDDWRPAPPLADGPDPASDEVATRSGTDLAWVGPADGVQVRVGGPVPRGLTLVLLHPYAQPGDEDTLLDEEILARGVRAGFVPRPHMRGRRHWGANRAWRSGRPAYNRTIQQVHVHHTASSNGYSRHDVPALIRGMYRYHTHHLGWSDIGYNFLVDRFGRIWTGRAGGVARAVRGAHTLGFNNTSTGIAVIGNFETARPSEAVLQAVAAVAAWKLRTYHRDPLAETRVWSRGSDKFRWGRQVVLPTIDGHRDTNDTACPGRHLYHHLPEIRQKTAALVRYYSRIHVLTPPTLQGTPRLGSTLRVDPGEYAPSDAALTYVWLRDGRPIPRASGPSYDVRPADVGTRLSVRITARKRGLKPATRRRWSSGRTTGPAHVSVTARSSDRRLRVDVLVSSPPGVRPTPTGKVVVKVAGRRAVVRLHDGRGTATFGAGSPLPPRRVWVKARYQGDAVHDKARALAKVRVRR
jgi:hypothetical protein